MPIIVEEHNPSAKWTIPDIKPEHVYKHKALFALKASTVFLDNRSVASIPSDDQMHYIKLTEILSADKQRSINAGYHFAHLGCVQIGVNPLFRAGLKATCVLLLLDTRHKNLQDQFLGGTEGTLADGPMYLQVRPNYNISLADPYFNEALTLKIKVAGVNLKNQTPNVEIAFNVIARAINIGLPAVYKGRLSSAEKQKQQGTQVLL